MNIYNQAIRVGLFFIFGVLLIWIVFETLSESTFYKENGYPVKVLFSDLKQLKLSDDVRVAGVRVGSVADTYLKDNHAVAVLNIENGFLIPKDSIASISTAGLLGSNYISILPGKSLENLEANDMVASLEKVDLSSMIEQVGDIGKRIDKFIAKLERAITQEGDKQGTIAMLLYDHEFASNLKSTASNIQSFSQKLNNENSTIGRLLSDDTLYQKAVDAVNKVQNAVSTIEDSGPITAVGVAATAIF